MATTTPWLSVSSVWLWPRLLMWSAPVSKPKRQPLPNKVIKRHGAMATRRAQHHLQQQHWHQHQHQFQLQLRLLLQLCVAVADTSAMWQLVTTGCKPCLASPRFASRRVAFAGRRAAGCSPGPPKSCYSCCCRCRCLLLLMPSLRAGPAKLPAS